MQSTPPLPISRKSAARSNVTPDALLQKSASTLGALYKPSTAYEPDQQGSLAKDLEPSNGAGLINVIKDYHWTLSKIDEEIPYVWLREYKCLENQIKRQTEAFLTQAGNTAGQALEVFGVKKGNTNELEIYKELFPKDQPTGFAYKFPYFNKNAFQLSTPNWTALPDAGQALSNLLSNTFGKVGETVAAAAGAVGDVVKFAAKMQTPAFGVADAPKVFKSHSERTINISFTLYNTLRPNDWKKNRQLGYLLVFQNLYNKRDYVTGVPPVFYDVFIPGQYYTYAAAMTDIKVEQLGNQRLLEDCIVPDAYQFDITLSELVMPSKNQLFAVSNGTARGQTQVQ